MSYEKSLIDSKQDDLISGTNIKTINGASILGSGDLVVTGSGASWGGITGTLSSQTDLQTALNGKASGTGTANGTNTGDQTSIVGITGTKAQFDTAVTDGNFVFVGDAVLNPEGWNVIVKSANQDVTNSATFVDDTDLQFSVVAGGHYMIELDLCYSSDSISADYKLQFASSSGTQNGRGSYVALTTAGSISLFQIQNGTGTGIGVFAANIDSLHSVKIIYSFTASANATFKYQFAQNSAVLATTSRTWKGSILKYKRID
jgi:hypothetical protein